MSNANPEFERYQTIYYSAGDTAQQLGVSVNMLRRYAKALEALQGKEAVHIDPQRGRQYTQAQVDILKRARDYVAVNRGSSVEDALRAALGMDGIVVRAPSPAPSEMALREAVEMAVRVALTEVVAPLERELAELRQEVRELGTQEDEIQRLRRYTADLEQRNAALASNQPPEQPHSPHLCLPAATSKPVCWSGRLPGLSIYGGASGGGSEPLPTTPRPQDGTDLLRSPRRSRVASGAQARARRGRPSRKRSQEG